MSHKTPARFLPPTDKRKAAIAAKVAALDNRTLLDSTLQLAGGDDYDGCFTREGQYEYDTLAIELTRRLTACGFLPPAQDANAS